MAKQGVKRRIQRQIEDVNGSGKPADLDVLQSLVTEMLLALGEKPGRNGLVKTPERVAKALAFMTQGYQRDIDQLLNGALFPIEYDEMVIVKDIGFFSMCGYRGLRLLRRIRRVDQNEFAILLQLQQMFVVLDQKPLKQERCVYPGTIKICHKHANSEITGRNFNLHGLSRVARRQFFSAVI